MAFTRSELTCCKGSEFNITVFGVVMRDSLIGTTEAKDPPKRRSVQCLTSQKVFRNRFICTHVFSWSCYIITQPSECVSTLMSLVFCADLRWNSSSDLDISVDRLPMGRTMVPMGADMNT
jgi:hypothetical protein